MDMGGYGYEITSAEIRNAFRYAMEAAANAGSGHRTLERIHKLEVSGLSGSQFVGKVLMQELGLYRKPQ